MDDLRQELHRASPPGSGEVDMDDLRARGRRRRRTSWSLAAVVVAVLVVPAGMLVAEWPTNSVEFEPAQPPTPTPEPQTNPETPADCDTASAPEAGADEVLVYFGCEHGTPHAQPWMVTAVTRPSGQRPLTAAVTAWLEGPTSEERQRGYGSATSGLGADDLLDVSIQDGHATVDFADDLFERASGWDADWVRLRVRVSLNEIVFQFPTVDSVTYTLAGDAEAFCAHLDLTRDCAPITQAQWQVERAQLAQGRDTATEADADWMTADDRDAWQDEHGQGTWVVAYFYPPDFAYDDAPPFTGLEARWKLISAEPDDRNREQRLRDAFAHLGSSPPPQLTNPFRSHDLELRSAILDGHKLTLDFADAPWIRVPRGTTGEGAMLSQLAAVAAHYAPDATELCILIDGDETELFSHGMRSCPHPLPG